SQPILGESFENFFQLGVRCPFGQLRAPQRVLTTLYRTWHDAGVCCYLPTFKQVTAAYGFKSRATLVKNSVKNLPIRTDKLQRNRAVFVKYRSATIMTLTQGVAHGGANNRRCGEPAF